MASNPRFALHIQQTARPAPAAAGQPTARRAPDIDHLVSPKPGPDPIGTSWSMPANNDDPENGRTRGCARGGATPGPPQPVQPDVHSQLPDSR